MASVADTGSGIAPEQRKKIFLPYYTTKSKGTGLGLSVSYDIVTAHGGRLDLLENNKPGACFRVRLPINNETTENKS